MCDQQSLRLLKLSASKVTVLNEHLYPSPETDLLPVLGSILVQPQGHLLAIGQLCCQIICFPLCGFPMVLLAVWLLLTMIVCEVQAAFLLFQMSHGHIRVWEVKAKTQFPADSITCEAYPTSRSMQVLSVFSVTKKTRIKVV